MPAEHNRDCHVASLEAAPARGIRRGERRVQEADLLGGQVIAVAGEVGEAGGEEGEGAGADGVEISDGVNPRRVVYVRCKGKSDIPLTRIGQPMTLAEVEKQAADLAKFLQVPIEGL